MTLGESLDEIGAERLNQDYVQPLRRQLQTFGFHLATLDVRQNSAFLEKALEQLLRGAGMIGEETFASWTPEKKREMLERELKSPRPFLTAGSEAGPEADAVLACYRVLATQRATHGAAGLGALIVSMTRSTEDLLVVYLLAREARLARRRAAVSVARYAVV